jgi:hypothetical protein
MTVHIFINHITLFLSVNTPYAVYFAASYIWLI